MTRIRGSCTVQIPSPGLWSDHIPESLQKAERSQRGARNKCLCLCWCSCSRWISAGARGGPHRAVRLTGGAEGRGRGERYWSGAGVQRGAASVVGHAVATASGAASARRVRLNARVIASSARQPPIFTAPANPPLDQLAVPPLSNGLGKSRGPPCRSLLIADPLHRAL